LLEHGDPKQWVIGIGNYGYDWPEGGVAATLSFEDAMARARLAGTQTVSVEPPLYQPHFSYEESGVLHSVWFLDAVTFRNQYATALSKRVGGVALYRLGQEDAALWTVMNKSWSGSQRPGITCARRHRGQYRPRRCTYRHPSTRNLDAAGSLRPSRRPGKPVMKNSQLIRCFIIAAHRN
jgi:hypothetical protein